MLWKCKRNKLSIIKRLNKTKHHSQKQEEATRQKFEFCRGYPFLKSQYTLDFHFSLGSAPLWISQLYENVRLSSSHSGGVTGNSLKTWQDLAGCAQWIHEGYTPWGVEAEWGSPSFCLAKQNTLHCVAIFLKSLILVFLKFCFYF